MTDNAFSWSVAIGAAATALTSYGQFGIYAPFLTGLDAVRIRASEHSVRLTGLDAKVSAISGCALIGAAALALGFDAVRACFAMAIALCAMAGFRVEVRVEPNHTRVVRKFLYVIPWSIRHTRVPPEAVADGWGDFMDPLALYLRVETSEIELGWEGKLAKRHVDDLAREFNNAVGRLTAPPLRGRHPFR